VSDGHIAGQHPAAAKLLGDDCHRGHQNPVSTFRIKLVLLASALALGISPWGPCSHLN